MRGGQEISRRFAGSKTGSELSLHLTVVPVIDVASVAVVDIA